MGRLHPAPRPGLVTPASHDSPFHTAKCDECDENNKGVMKRCGFCAYKICPKCIAHYGGMPGALERHACLNPLLASNCAYPYSDDDGSDLTSSDEDDADDKDEGGADEHPDEDVKSEAEEPDEDPTTSKKRKHSDSKKDASGYSKKTGDRPSTSQNQKSDAAPKGTKRSREEPQAAPSAKTNRGAHISASDALKSNKRTSLGGTKFTANRSRGVHVSSSGHFIVRPPSPLPGYLLRKVKGKTSLRSMYKAKSPDPSSPVRSPLTGGLDGQDERSVFNFPELKSKLHEADRSSPAEDSDDTVMAEHESEEATPSRGPSFMNRASRVKTYLPKNRKALYARAPAFIRENDESIDEDSNLSEEVDKYSDEEVRDAEEDVESEGTDILFPPPKPKRQRRDALDLARRRSLSDMPKSTPKLTVEERIMFEKTSRRMAANQEFITSLPSPIPKELSASMSDEERKDVQRDIDVATEKYELGQKKSDLTEPSDERWSSCSSPEQRRAYQEDAEKANRRRRRYVG